jgi:short-subunit dehydrogenase
VTRRSPDPQRVVVLGASSGLGAALALLHARRGDWVTAAARREHRLIQLQQAAAGGSGRWTSTGADLSSPRSVQALASLLAGHRVDRLYLNAAAIPPRPAGSVTDRIAAAEDYHRLLVVSYVALTEFLIDAAALTPQSTVVAVSSLAAAVPFPRMELYCAGKSALEGWCKARRDPNAPRFAIVRPGVFGSEFFTPSAELIPGSLPLARAARILAGLDKGREFIDTGGWRDILASRLSSLAGPRSRRVISGKDLHAARLPG